MQGVDLRQFVAVVEWPRLPVAGLAGFAEATGRAADSIAAAADGVIAAAAGNRLRVLPLSGPIGQVSGDRGRIGQILLNLVTNARDAMEATGNGTITIHTGRTQDGRVALTRSIALAASLAAGVGGFLLFLQFGAADGLDSFDILRSAHGPNLLRMKGIVKLADDPSRPVVIHAVQALMAEPVRLKIVK